MGEVESIRLTHGDYTIGWVCALPKEQTAAFFMLDGNQHEDLPNPPNDHNAYVLGRVGNHNVVIACLPMGRIGNNNSATVAAQMITTFPNVKVGLMVGIGGGVPPKVRLGDIVVSCPSNGDPGVIQWDMGKAETGGEFKRTGHLNDPPTALLTALSKFETNPVGSRAKIVKYLEDLKYKKDVPRGYIKSDKLVDVLYKTKYNHVGKGQDAQDDDDDDDDDGDAWEKDIEEGEMDDCRLCDPSMTVKRLPREELMIHYGLIASGNQVIKDARTRNNLKRDFKGNVLCIEMEAAGLMNNFPCIVIRGICDYADSHKNKAWQEYAAATAAAYAKALLSVLPVSDIDGMQAIKDSLIETAKRFFRGDKPMEFPSVSGIDTSAWSKGGDEKQSPEKLTDNGTEPHADTEPGGTMDSSDGNSESSSGNTPNDSSDDSPNSSSGSSAKNIPDSSHSGQDRGTDSDSTQESRGKRLQQAVEDGLVAEVQRLLEEGADVVAANEHGQTPLIIAAEKGHVDIVKLLLTASGGNVDLKDGKCGRTALGWAAANGHGPIVELLLGTGKVDIESADKDGLTPRQLAKKGGYDDIMPPELDELNRDLECRHTLQDHPGDVYAAIFSFDCKLVASSSQGDNLIRIWDATTGQCRKTFRADSKDLDLIALSSSNSKLLVSSLNGNKIQIWDATTGQCQQTIKNDGDTFCSAVFSPSFELMVTSSGSNDSLCIWDATKGQLERTLDGHQDSIQTINLSTDSKLIASGSSDQTIKIWDAVTGQCQWTLSGHEGAISSVVFSPDSGLLASTSEDQCIKIWDIATGQCRQTLHCNSTNSGSIVFSFAANLVAFPTYRNVQIWDVTTGKCHRTLDRLDGYIYSLAFTPAGHLMALDIDGENIKVWSS